MNNMFFNLRITDSEVPEAKAAGCFTVPKGILRNLLKNKINETE